MARKYPLTESQSAKLVSESRMGIGLPIKLGCRLLLTSNSPTDAYVNGDTGTLVDVQEYTKEDEDRSHKLPFKLIVILDRGGTEVVVYPVKKSIMLDPTMTAQELIGFPCLLGYAQTIHSVQGQTLNKAYVDIPSICEFPTLASRHGLAYVALSRTRTLEGLYLSGWDRAAVYCDPAVSVLV
jgi:ATP-dependent DNA helicase PIF1